uniref:Uncharacterized protein n=1 Tax=Arundo donax TaxID=35708 RepID=A0A0A9H9L9_ARUDO
MLSLEIQNRYEIFLVRFFNEKASRNCYFFWGGDSQHFWYNTMCENKV